MQIVALNRREGGRVKAEVAALPKTTSVAAVGVVGSGHTLGIICRKN